jgi:hypothetical protein
METDFLKIFIPMFISASYDYDIWFGYGDETTGVWWEKPFRILKFIADYPVTIFILAVCLWDINLIGAYYFAKLIGWCDAVYILKWKLYRTGDRYFENGKQVTWLWWTFPMGWILTIIAISNKRKFTKGVVSGYVFQWQLMLGLIASYLLYHFEVFSIAYNWLTNLL